MPKRWRVTELRDTGGFGGQHQAVAIVQLNNDVPPPPGAVEVPGDTLLHDFAVAVEADYPERPTAAQTQGTPIVGVTAPASGTNPPAVPVPPKVEG
jgi:hypothetical protein